MAENNKITSENIIEEEQKILKEEKEILSEIRKEERLIKRLTRNLWLIGGSIALIIAAGAAGLIYWNAAQGRVYIEKSEISAPRIDLAPQNAGILEEVNIHEGDSIFPDTVVARIGNELIKNRDGGVIINVNNNIGKLFNRGEAVVSTIDPSQLRVVGHLEEDRGLQYVKIGQAAIFTVDAFGSKEYYGVVDEISPSSRRGDVVFNISDQRQTNQFDVKVRFDFSRHPELKNGMSAKLWIYK